MTLALCANMDGSIKIKPVLIGKAKSPRPFRRIVPARYVWYGHSTNAWMTTPLFNRFLSDFDAEMSRRRIPKALLVLDNAPAHLQLPSTNLCRTVVAFLPPNTTSIT